MRYKDRTFRLDLERVNNLEVRACPISISVILMQCNNSSFYLLKFLAATYLRVKFSYQ